MEEKKAKGIRGFLKEFKPDPNAPAWLPGVNWEQLFQPTKEPTSLLWKGVIFGVGGEHNAQVYDEDKKTWRPPTKAEQRVMKEFLEQFTKGD